MSMNSGKRQRHPRKGTLRRIGEPVPAEVRADSAGVPVTVDGREVASIRQSWLVEDGWWTLRPVARRYWEIVDRTGAVRTVYRDSGRDWFSHG
jgi:hypothetical protein